MPIPAKVKNYLDKLKWKYEEVPHRKVFTVYDLAQTTKLKLNTIVKTLLIKADKEYKLVLLPANKRVDLNAVKKLLGAKKITLSNEKEMIKAFKVKPGAMTAFGKLHKVGVLLDKSLLKTEKMLFSAGSFTDSLRLKLKDYVKFEEPTVGAISEKSKK